MINKSFDKSLELFKTAKKIIPACTQTFSKGYTQFAFGVSPVFIEKGLGSHAWDIDGNEYIDYSLALGPVTLGHAYPLINEVISSQLAKGIIHSLPHPLEVALSEILTEIIPCADMVRFGKNGSDVTSAAVRAARAFTGREKIACCGYHGWQDWYIGTTTRAKGIPEAVKALTLTFSYNRIDSLKKLFHENRDEISAVIMEPYGIIEPEGGFLEEVREITHANGAVLIFDEVITGFRLSLGGAQEYFNVIPDIACFGKGMANGMPISAIVGRRDIMEIFDEIFFSLTFGGETLSLAASIATINEMRNRDVISHFWNQGKKLKDGYNELSRKHDLDKYTECIGLPPRTLITFRDSDGNESCEMKTLIQQETIKRGLLFCSVHNMCYAHTDDDIETTLNIYDESLHILARALEERNLEKYIKGEIVWPVFRKV